MRFTPQVSIPFIAGQWSLPAAPRRRTRRRRGFQSPSLRGSGRFTRTSSGRGWPRPGFNPLHCGAVVASRCARRMAGGGGGVSIPFIAGQWSLRDGAVVGGVRPPAHRFNPLHCGAVVASWTRGPGKGGEPPVSIPFIAGQWSLHVGPPAVWQGGRDVSIPFIAGQWSLPSGSRPGAGPTPRRFNPLHCGAVVASKKLDRPPPHGGGFNPLHCGAVVASRSSPPESPPYGGFQSPSLRGSGRFKKTRSPPAAWRRFQSPSLRGSGRFFFATAALAVAATFQSPSLRGSGRFRLKKCQFDARALVSIPFIAGQWSLHDHGDVAWSALSEAFQSPSLRGSGRFPVQRSPAHRGAGVSIPFIAGQWSLRGGARRRGLARRVSIPFIAGQWSLRGSVRPYRRRGAMFQSPSLRGSGRFGGRGLRGRPPRRCFNPLHCGAVVASRPRRGTLQRCPARFNPLHCGAVVASRTPPCKACASAWRFNPLHCGAVVASLRSPYGGRMRRRVSIPFIAGQWSLRASADVAEERDCVSIPFIAGQWSLPAPLAARRGRAHMFQSPSLRGSGRFPPTRRRATRSGGSFNPLHCGAVVASKGGNKHECHRGSFQSPSLRGSGRFPSHGGPGSPSFRGFNPLHCGAVVASSGLGVPF